MSFIDWAGENDVLPPGEILYIEVVEWKNYAYLKDSVWRISYGLQQFMDEFGSAGFVRNLLIYEITVILGFAG